MRRILTGLYFLCSTVTCWCQDIFELKCKLPELPPGIACTALLLRNPDSTGFVRLAWTDTKKRAVVVDMELIREVQQEFVYPPTGEQYLFCKAEVVKTIEGQFKNNFNYINFWLRKSIFITGEYEPCTDSIPVLYDDPMDDEHHPEPVFAGLDSADTTQNKFWGAAPNVVTFKRLAVQQLNRNYLARYFAAWEIRSQEKFTVQQLMALRHRDQPALYCISVVDIKDSSIGATCATDGRRVNYFFRDVARFLRLPYKPILIENSNFGKQAITNTIKRIQPSKNDIVVFYYSGHGFSYRNDEAHPFPQLALWRGDAASKAMLRASTMNVEEIYTAVKAKAARLNIVISDCCNSFVEMQRYEDMNVRIPLRHFPRWNKVAAAKLFLDTRNTFLLAATKKGQLAGSNTRDGGFFTQAFCQTFIRQLENKNDNNPKWMDLIKRTGINAAAKSSGFICVDKPCDQTMIYKTAK